MCAAQNEPFEGGGLEEQPGKNLCRHEVFQLIAHEITGSKGTFRGRRGFFRVV
jgi:hypothetical protein